MGYINNILIQNGGIIMSNMLDYLKWRGDLSFSQDPFNEVDNLVFSILCYNDFDGIVPNLG